MKYIIFYSWQSDLPNNTNRGFIEAVIEKAVKNTNESDLYELEPSIDRDTKDVPGAPNISQILIDKIKACDAFVADISIVTGISDPNERPSPNPNVLLELGYAIALLGWEKIILFCNELYGKDEDLPFDIRQHRRIGYHLKQDESKSQIRNDLAKHFQSRLIELLKAGKALSSVKKPVLEISWNYLSFEEEVDLESGVDSHDLQLQRATDNSEIKDRVTQEIALVNETDGSIDPKWSEKKEKFIKLANEFIGKLSDEQSGRDYLIDNNSTKLCPVTLTVHNDGNASASDIRATIYLPEWVLAFEKFPNKRNVPTKPNMPVPSSPRLSDPLRAATVSGRITSMDTGLNPTLFRNAVNRTSACYLKNMNEIYFWADRLLHKHVITNKDDRFFLLALPNAPVGKHIVKGKVFCSEQDDWSELQLIIKVV